MSYTLSSSWTSCPCAFAMVFIMVPSNKFLASISPRAAGVAPMALLMASPNMSMPRARLMRTSFSTDVSSSTFLPAALSVTSTSSRDAATMVSKNVGRLCSIASCIFFCASGLISTPSPASMPSVAAVSLSWKSFSSCFMSTFAMSAFSRQPVVSSSASLHMPRSSLMVMATYDSYLALSSSSVGGSRSFTASILASSASSDMDLTAEILL
mmetsp:Transcript_1713/g.3501  ORF Transcript_1713/g.3501 Transcript_1713/m.3501 type:complete len:211 (-) Transcript_1713:1357-1989(-)